MNRAAEIAKYAHVYQALPDYRMGEARKADARDDLRAAFEHGCRSYLDIGCGRGEMLEYARTLGYTDVAGLEVVPALCGGDVMQCAIHDLHKIPSLHYDLVTSFDVIEHVLPDDDSTLLAQMARIARKYLTVTANNRPSIDPTTGNDLHVNIRDYDAWDLMIRTIWQSTLFEPNYSVERAKNKRYISETWRAWR